MGLAALACRSNKNQNPSDCRGFRREGRCVAIPYAPHESRQRGGLARHFSHPAGGRVWWTGVAPAVTTKGPQAYCMAYLYGPKAPPLPTTRCPNPVGKVCGRGSDQPATHHTCVVPSGSYGGCVRRRENDPDPGLVTLAAVSPLQAKG